MSGNSFRDVGVHAFLEAGVDDCFGLVWLSGVRFKLSVASTDTLVLL